MGSRTVSVMVLSSKVVVLAGCLCLLVDALHSPQPIPAPEPFFGLGLLGRLLAAYSSGEKDEDKGNCKCNRRTFHTKEKDKDEDCPCDSYGAPVSYNAPTNSYDPIDSYGSPLAPVATGYGAPDACNCDCTGRTFHTKEKEKEKDKKCNCDCYSSGYGAPSYEYQPPSVGYTSPVDSYGAPVQSYQPYDSYGAPVSDYGAPVSDYGAPSSVCACDRTFGPHKEKEKDKKPCDCSGYPTYDYGPPAVSYSYGAPAPSYNPPCTFRRTFNKEKDKDKKPCYSYFYRL